MSKKADDKLGYEFEKEVQDILKDLQTKYPLFWHRFLDSKSAGRLVASQPSDFLVTAKDRPTYLLEAKASCEKKSLASCAKSHIRPSQIGMHKKWHRAGNPSLFIFYCEIDNRVELWDGEYVTGCISNNERMNILGGGHLLAVCDYFKLNEMLMNYFCKD